MRLIIGKLLFSNDVALHGDNGGWDPDKEYPGLSVYNNWYKPPLWVKFTPRKN
jgi:hypothetical protein